MTTLCLAAQDPALVRHWDYDPRAPLDAKAIKVEKRPDLVLHDLTYASPKGGRVPAWLVVPRGKGPFPAIVWGHWYWDNSPLRNRGQFLEEALLLARHGVVSILTDGPIARPGHVPDRTPLNEQQFEDMTQQVVDMRRAVDLLLSRKMVDPARIAFVGHSYNASVGAVLSGVERRLKAFVLMAGGLSDEVDLLTEGYRKYREKVGPARFDAFVAAHPYSDPGQYIRHAAPATVFLQFATQEDFLTPEHVRKYLPHVSDPKLFKLYEAPHALNAEARADRIGFLAKALGFKAPPPPEIAQVPDLVQPPEGH